MRCPHCAGEISDHSRFCGICGRKLVAPTGVAARPAPAPTPAPELSGQSSMSLFELPVSRGARLARVALVLALDLVLAGAGIAMIVSYLHARERAGAPAADPSAGPQTSEARVEDLQPTLAVAPANPSEPADAVERTASSPPAARPPSGGARPSSSRPAGAAPSTPDRSPQPAPAKPPAKPSGTSGGTGSQPSAPPPRPAEPAPSPPADSPAPADPGADPMAPEDPYPDSGEPTAQDMEIFTGRVSLVFKRHQAQMTRCYEQAAKLTKKDEPLHGRVEVRFQVDQDGKAQNVRVVENTTDSDQLGQCVTSLLSSWTFPAAPGARPIELKWPFRFSPP